MTNTTLVRASRIEDIDFLRTRLRPVDCAEIQACGCYSGAADALAEGLRESALCFTALSPSTGEPAAMFGLLLMPGDAFHHVWLLGTEEVERHAATFLRYSRRWVDVFLTYGDIGNCVLATNAVHIRWLTWCGFARTADFTTARGERMFCFVKRRSF